MIQMLADFNSSPEKRPFLTGVLNDYNMFLVTTAKGRSLIARWHFMVGFNNPFNIAALMVACKRLGLQHLSRSTKSPLKEDIIARHVCLAQLSSDVFIEEEHADLMLMAIEKFAVYITGGISYNEPVAVLLW